MTSGKEKPPLGVQMISRVLRQLRTGAGLTQDQLARKVTYARSVVGNTEQGRELPSAEFLAACDAFFGTGTLLIDMRADVLSAGSLPDWALELRDAEARAVSILDYEPSIVPGLLQTPDYAGAMLSAGMLGYPDERQLEARVADRLDRQRIFGKDPRPVYWVILAEGVLQRIVGGPDVMRGQLEYLVDAMERHVVNLQILPCSAGPATLASPVVLLEMPDGTVFMHDERPFAGSTTMNPGMVRECRNRFDAMRAQAASLGESARIVRARLEDLQP